jgi:hypothetical protein
MLTLIPFMPPGFICAADGVPAVAASDGLSSKITVETASFTGSAVASVSFGVVGAASTDVPQLPQNFASSDSSVPQLVQKMEAILISPLYFIVKTLLNDIPFTGINQHLQMNK